ncbi:hypothetical protein AQUCO_00700681v1 [Aquilegia coerulea]|uniref:Subtilisin-like protease fibronectin type-III domain-containing protein n=1 Tax=Aquilegia coerulea TaxID=218851 RepID=A0A2G5ELC6_AQUCA|nr:hypothetical protein AQUCO_00700681v1 [Aquilegia coerulea]
MECINILYLFLYLFLFLHIASPSSEMERPWSYIIHMDKSALPAPFSTLHSWYTATLISLSTKDKSAPIHLYTYKHVMDGFSAVLYKSQLDQLERLPGHIATYQEQFGQLHTSHTPKFLGLKKHAGLLPAGGFGDDMIIGARSFSKGMKQQGLNISTTDDYDSPRDFLGHGTHTSSTAAGSRVEDANYFGYAKGTVVGVAPLARLAMYKVYFLNGTDAAAATDILAGMDQAIEDGVDLMSLSLGLPETPFYYNPIAMGSFAAMEKGVFVSCSAGNGGPHGYTISNGAPWITTVGAGTIDRDFFAHVTLGDGVATFKGRSIYPENLFVSRVSLYYGHGNTSKQNCEFYSLDPNEVSGKIVFCSFNDETNVFGQLDEVERAGAKGAIFATDSAQFLHPKDFVMPFVAISLIDGELVEDYLTKTLEATVDIKFQITELGTKPAPQVAYFSSRGPSGKSPWVLKPDILAPGVNILAAWVPNRGQAPIGDNYLLTNYALESGTSMASPHVVGIAALLKSAHRDWSSAAIRSAMMTTADVLDNENGQILDMDIGTAATPLDFGAGHVNPNKALDPGLVYDIEVEDYINYLCALNYTNQQINVITRRTNYSCDQATLDLNYPSFIVILNNTNTTNYTFKRVLTNVADSHSVYRAAIWAPSNMKVVVKPMTLTFETKHSKAEFTMEVEVDAAEGYRTESGHIINYGYLSWHEVNGNHVVRSPIVSAFAL